MYKEQKLKPNVFTNISGVIKNEAAIDLSFGKINREGEDIAGCKISDDDQCILEDSSGRINVKVGANFKPEEHVTGTIIALLGASDHQGYF